jgi:hypothetical protein
MFTKEQIEQFLKEAERLTDERTKLNRELSDINTKLNGLNALISAYDLKTESLAPISVIDNSYPVDSNIPDRIIYAIKSLQKLHVSTSAIEIANFMAKHEQIENDDITKFQAKISTYCSNMSNKGLLLWTKQGKKYLYDIPLIII